MREKKKIQMREARQVFKSKRLLPLTKSRRAQKKLAKRRWDPPKKPRAKAAERLEDAPVDGEIPLGWTREYSPAVR
jgi:hypothetical protein